MRIALIAGSASEFAHTTGLLMHIQSVFASQKIKADIWNLYHKQIPILLPDYHRDPMKSPVSIVREFVQFVEESDAVILATPLYNGSYSGVLKNALDNLRYNSFQNKPVGLVTNASNLRNTIACEHLRSVVRTLYGYATQTQVGTQDDDYKIQRNQYILMEQSMRERCVRLVHEILFLSSVLNKL